LSLAALVIPIVLPYVVPASSSWPHREKKIGAKSNRNANTSLVTEGDETGRSARKGDRRVEAAGRATGQARFGQETDDGSPPEGLVDEGWSPLSSMSWAQKGAPGARPGREEQSCGRCAVRDRAWPARADLTRSAPSPFPHPCASESGMARAVTSTATGAQKESDVPLPAQQALRLRTMMEVSRRWSQAWHTLGPIGGPPIDWRRIVQQERSAR
jgi:hypothetical protein